jgi:hypothetical protein
MPIVSQPAPNAHLENEACIAAGHVDRLQFACNLLLMLPEQVAKLSRRKAANAVECCCAAAALAQVGVSAYQAVQQP